MAQYCLFSVNYINLILKPELNNYGAHWQNRTADLLLTMEPLYRLS